MRMIWTPPLHKGTLPQNNYGLSNYLVLFSLVLLLLIGFNSILYAAIPEPSATFTANCLLGCKGDFYRRSESATGKCSVSNDCEFDQKLVINKLDRPHKRNFGYQFGVSFVGCLKTNTVTYSWSGGSSARVPRIGGTVKYAHTCEESYTAADGSEIIRPFTLTISYSVSAALTCPAGFDVAPGNEIYECTAQSSVKISGTPPSPVFDGDRYLFKPTVDSLNNVKFAATGLPTGLSINSTTGEVNGIPTVVNSFSGSITATDTTNRDRASLNFTIVVNESPNKSPVARISGPTRAGIGESVEFSGINSSDPDANDTIDSYMWTVSGGTAIAGLNQSTLSVEFSSLGTASVSLVVTDSRGKQSSSTAQTITVKPFGDLSNRGVVTGGLLCNGTNPVNGADGNKVQPETDYAGTGTNPLIFTRYYNSLSTKKENFGSNWRHSYNQSIELDSIASPAQAYVYRADGSSIRFTRTASGWWSDRGVTEQLSETVTEWKLIENDDTIKTFLKPTGPADAILTKISFRNGVNQALNYVTGRLDKVVDDYGRSLTFAYDADSRIESLTDPAGDMIQYSYANNNIDTVTYQDGTTRQYVYENITLPHHLSGIIDQNGVRYATWTYDNRGRAISSSHAGGADIVNIDYNADGTTTFTDALGQARTHTFSKINGIQKLDEITGPACNVCGGRGQSNTYDKYGNRDIVTDFKGIVTDYNYNSRGLIEQVIEAKGTADERVTQTLWHPDFRVPACVIASLNTTIYSYNEYNPNFRGQPRVSTVYDTTDNTLFPDAASKSCIAINARPDKFSLNQRETVYTYVQGQLHILSGPRRDVYSSTVYDYDFAKGNLLTIKNALRQITTTFSNYDAHGRPRTITDANGMVTTISYDAMGRKDIVTAGQQVTNYDYYPNGQLDMVTRPDGSFLDYVYDDASRLTDLYDQLGNHIQYTLNSLGRRTKVDTMDPAGVLKRTRSSQYDLENRLQKSIGAVGQTTNYVSHDANGNVEEIQDPGLNSTLFTYDALNRLKTTTDAKNGVSRYSYDTANNIISVTSPNNLVTHNTYDGLGNRTQLISPDTGTTVYQYDNAGNMVSMSNALGKTTTYKYDPLNRVLKITYQDGTTTSYIYDRKSSNGMGRLSVVEYVSGAFAGNSVDLWEYDLNGNVITKKQWNTLWKSNPDFTTNYSYDVISGQLKSKTTPAGQNIEYGYLDAQLNSITVDGQKVMSSISYDPFGPAITWTFGSGKVVNRGYNQDGQLEAYQEGNKKLLNIYYPTGNLKSISEIASKTASASYLYDELNRVAGYRSGMSTETYEYDANNNRISQSVNAINYTSTITATSNQLANRNGPAAKTYGYDVVGNTISDSVNTFQYDDRGRLNGLNNHEMRYIISGLNTRNWKEGYYRRSHDLNLDGEVDKDDRRLMQDAVDGSIPRSQIFDRNNDLVVNQADLARYDSTAGNNSGTSDNSNSNSDSNGGNNTSGDGIHIDVRFVYNSMGQLEGEYNDQGEAIQETIWFEGQPVVVLRDTQYYYIDSDHLGTPRSISDEDNEVVWQWKSDPYGVALPNAVINEDADGDGELFVYNLRFAGQYYDIETGFHYNINRIYDPSTGRYLESDPTGLEGGLNTYGYVSQNPVNSLDPAGLHPISLYVTSANGLQYHEGCMKDQGGNHRYYRNSQNAMVRINCNAPKAILPKGVSLEASLTVGVIQATKSTANSGTAWALTFPYTKLGAGVAMCFDNVLPDNSNLTKSCKGKVNLLPDSMSFPIGPTGVTFKSNGAVCVSPAGGGGVSWDLDPKGVNTK